MPDLQQTIRALAREGVLTDAQAGAIFERAAAGIIDERAAQTVLDLHRSAQAAPDGPPAVSGVEPPGDLSAEASAKAERFGKFVLVEKIGEGGMPGSMKAGPSCGGGRLRRLAVRVGGQISS